MEDIGLGVLEAVLPGLAYGPNPVVAVVLLDLVEAHEEELVRVAAC